MELQKKSADSIFQALSSISQVLFFSIHTNILKLENPDCRDFRVK